MAATVVFLASCATRDVGYSPGSTVPLPTEPWKWNPIAKGIRWAAVVRQDPPIRAWAVEVDLETPDLEVFVTPGDPSGGLETTGRTTSEAVREFDLLLAVNGGPFWPYARRSGTPQDVVGLAVSDGRRYSEPEKGYAALIFEADNTATVSSEFHDLDAVAHGLGGFLPLLQNGKNLGTRDSREPRTAAGVGKNGRFLILLVVDGRQPRWSVGMTTAETAEWLRSLGASDAINLDGGGSTTLALRRPPGRVDVLNRPVNYNLIGNERVVANHLGFRAAPLGENGE